MCNYQEKNILFSTDGILGYKESVQNELEKRFKYVEYIEKDIHQDCKKDFFYKFLRELSRKETESGILYKLFKKYKEKYISKLMEQFSEKFDYFLVVAGQEFSKDFISELKRRNPQIKCILFLWDTLEETALKNSAFEYDYVFSFDPEDCKKYNFKFRPIFYIEECENNVPSFEEKEYDLYYLGALRDKKRLNIVRKFEEYSKNKNLKNFLRVVYNKKTIKILNGKNKDKFLSDQKISYKENREILKKSKVVLDLNFEKQNGLTIRASEAIGTKTKIITTNKYINQYDFYDENNVYYIEKEEEIKDIPISFFKTKYKDIKEEVKRKYTTAGFIEDIFERIEEEK